MPPQCRSAQLPAAVTYARSGHCGCAIAAAVLRDTSLCWSEGKKKEMSSTITSTRAAKWLTAAIMSASVATAPNEIRAPGARSWTISIIAVPSSPRWSEPDPNARDSANSGASPAACAASSPRTPSEITATRTPVPSMPNSARAAAAPSCASPSVNTAPAA